MTPETAARFHVAQHSLFVEGPDDGSVVNALVLAKTGVDLSKGERRIVKLNMERSGFGSAVANFVDAATRLGPTARAGLLVDRGGRSGGEPDRWEQVRAALANVGVVPPERPTREGIVLARQNGSRVGAWLMPDNVNIGDLETFVEDLLPAETPLWRWAREATAEARKHGATYLPKDVYKAGVHTWLAWANEPGGGYGIAIKRGDLPSDGPIADSFVDWMRRLFLDP